MTTLIHTFPASSQDPAIIIPHKTQPLYFSAQQLTSHVSTFQKKLAQLGVVPEAAVSIALPNSYEFIVAFLAVTWQRAIAAPLNPAYKQEEFEFYIEDLTSGLVLVPKDSAQHNEPAVRAAQKKRTAIAECFWNGHEVDLEVKDRGNLVERTNQPAQNPRPDDIALVLHTSGTTGRPKAVRVLLLRNHERVELIYASRCHCRIAT